MATTLTRPTSTFSKRSVQSLRQLPTGASAPVVRKFDPNASPILNLAFTGAPLDELYDIATNQIQPALASVPGVGQVNTSGGLQREIQVQLDYTRWPRTASLSSRSRKR